ncbi:unnamed protein product [Pipistrellus nathusii]|uniref:Uncharacterized protein n=1 Tax=Pipistrellus nathusii TaxID=59473 RepID=A0ABN9ZNM8_PIPNA
MLTANTRGASPRLSGADRSHELRPVQSLLTALSSPDSRPEGSDTSTHRESCSHPERTCWAAPCGRVGILLPSKLKPPHSQGGARNAHPTFTGAGMKISIHGLSLRPG